jgi:hypothetical protein
VGDTLFFSKLADLLSGSKSIKPQFDEMAVCHPDGVFNNPGISHGSHDERLVALNCCGQILHGLLRNEDRCGVPGPRLQEWFVPVSGVTM